MAAIKNQKKEVKGEYDDSSDEEIDPKHIHEVDDDDNSSVNSDFIE